MSKTQFGTVKFFMVNQGYGFITPDGESPDARGVMVHYSAIDTLGFRVLEAGQRVEFGSPEVTPRGRLADWVKPVESFSGVFSPNDLDDTEVLPQERERAAQQKMYADWAASLRRAP